MLTVGRLANETVVGHHKDDTRCTLMESPDENAADVTSRVSVAVLACARIVARSFISNLSNAYSVVPPLETRKLG